MQFFFRNCTHISTTTQGKKFEDMFLVKIASQGTSLNIEFFFKCSRTAPYTVNETKKPPEKLSIIPQGLKRQLTRLFATASKNYVITSNDI